MGEVVPFMSVAEAFEHKVASLLREKFPEGWVGHDVFVGEEQTDVLAVLSQGIFAIECKAYTGKVFGDANGPWKAVKEGRERVIEPRGRNPYRQALTKAFAVSNFLQVTLDANPHLRVGEKPWIHACAVFPEEADLSYLNSLYVNPRIVLPRGQGKAIVFHPGHLSQYIGFMGKGLESGPASALVLALGGKTDGTWIEGKVEEKAEEEVGQKGQQGERRRKWKLRVVWQ